MIFVLSPPTTLELLARAADRYHDGDPTTAGQLLARAAIASHATDEVYEEARLALGPRENDAGHMAWHALADTHRALVRGAA